MEDLVIPVPLDALDQQEGLVSLDLRDETVVLVQLDLLDHLD